MLENAKYGDQFMTKDGRIATYGMKDVNGIHWLLLEKSVFTWGYNDDGVLDSNIDDGFTLIKDDGFTLEKQLEKGMDSLAFTGGDSYTIYDALCRDEYEWYKKAKEYKDKGDDAFYEYCMFMCDDVKKQAARFSELNIKNDW